MSSVTAADIKHLEMEVEQAQKRLADAKKLRIDECDHEIDKLTLSSGAIESRCAAYTDRQITVRCTCGLSTSRYVRWHND